MICDPGERYIDTYYNEDWVRAQGLDPSPHAAQIEEAYETAAGGSIARSAADAKQEYRLSAESGERRERIVVPP